MSRASGDRAGAASDPNNGSLVLVSVKWKFKLVILEPSGLCRLRGYDGSCNLAGYLETLCASLTALCEVITFRTAASFTRTHRRCSRPPGIELDKPSRHPLA